MVELASGGLVFRIKEIKEPKQIGFSWQAKYLVEKKNPIKFSSFLVKVS